MALVLIALVAALAAVVTLLSGFGLGTIILAAFMLLFDAPVAVAAAAVVHLANNIFKLVLVGRWADRRVVVGFGLPAVIGAMIGAAGLLAMSTMPAIARYEVLGHERRITVVKLVIGLLILVFASLDLAGVLGRWAIPRRWMALGGLLSGFFGGLSGHQGALRSITLLRLGLDKQRYIGTTSVCSLMVDLVRLGVYMGGAAFFAKDFSGLGAEQGGPVMAAIVGALFGSLVGRRLVPRISMAGIHRLVGVLLILLGASLSVGLL